MAEMPVAEVDAAVDAQVAGGQRARAARLAAVDVQVVAEYADGFARTPLVGAHVAARALHERSLRDAQRQPLLGEIERGARLRHDLADAQAGAGRVDLREDVGGQLAEVDADARQQGLVETRVGVRRAGRRLERHFVTADPVVADMDVDAVIAGGDDIAALKAREIDALGCAVAEKAGIELDLGKIGLRDLKRGGRIRVAVRRPDGETRQHQRAERSEAWRVRQIDAWRARHIHIPGIPFLNWLSGRRRVGSKPMKIIRNPSCMDR